MSFDLKKYLAEGKLFKEELSNQEQDIVDDILSVTEGFDNIMDKIKSYTQKGLLTVVVLASVVGSLKAQNQLELANQVEKSTLKSVEDRIIPGKGTGDRVLTKNTFRKRYLDYINSIDYHNDDMKKRGFYRTGQTNSGGYTMITYEDETEVVVKTFYYGKYKSQQSMFK